MIRERALHSAQQMPPYANQLVELSRQPSSALQQPKLPRWASISLVQLALPARSRRRVPLASVARRAKHCFRNFLLAALAEFLRRVGTAALLLVLAELPLTDHPGDLDFDANDLRDHLGNKLR